MAEQHRGRKWAELRFAVIGALVAAPPKAGELQGALCKLCERHWTHPLSGEPVRFAFSTIERWYYLARNARNDPLAALRRRLRKDRGRQRALSAVQQEILLAQYRDNPNWSYQLHADNLGARIAAAPELGPAPAYANVRRFFVRRGLLRRRRLPNTPGGRQAQYRVDHFEVRSFEVEYVCGLWHLDFHHGRLRVLDARGQWITPILLAVVDDRSRLCCHAQWYAAETTATLVHGFIQALLKRGLPRALLTDNGSPMLGAEFREGLTRLGIVHETTLPHSPYQNGKQENFFARVEGRLVALVQNEVNLSLEQLNTSTQAWVEMDYHRTIHGETAQTPVERFVAGPDVGRRCPSLDTLRRAFTAELSRSQRRSDGTIRVHGVRFEIAARYRHLGRVHIRTASWDLSHLYLVDAATDTIVDTLYPLDRNRNASGQRRALGSEPLSAASDGPEPRPALLAKLLADYAASGLAPAYLPEPTRPDKDKENKS